MAENKVFTKNEFGEKLMGLEARPNDAREKYPTVLLVHGFGVTKEEGGKFDELTKRFVARGCLVYRFDFSGRGESEGDYSQTSLTKLVGDLRNIFEFVKNQPLVDENRIGILTQSFGGPVTTALAPAVKAIVFIGTFVSAVDLISRVFGAGYNPGGVSVRKYPDGHELKMGPQFWADFKNHDLAAQVKKIKCPKLFAHGAADEKIPVSDMEILFNAALEPKEKLIVPGLDHDWAPNREQMYEPVVDWLVKHLAS